MMLAGKFAVFKMLTCICPLTKVNVPSPVSAPASNDDCAKMLLSFALVICSFALNAVCDEMIAAMTLVLCDDLPVGCGT